MTSMDRPHRLSELENISGEMDEKYAGALSIPCQVAATRQITINMPSALIESIQRFAHNQDMSFDLAVIAALFESSALDEYL